MNTGNDIIQLKSRISALERENARLKRLLDEAGIPYAQGRLAAPESGRPPQEITTQLARRYFSYFWGRTDVYSKRFQNQKTGKSGYYPQCRNFWKSGICPKASGAKVKCADCRNREWTELNAAQIENHLRGMREDCSDVIGIYPLFPDGTCRLLVFDFDDHEADGDDTWMEEVDALREICRINSIPALVERSRSGRGAHLWIFFEKPVSAGVARRFGFALLEKGAGSVNLKTFRYYDRMLPAQEQLPAGGLGNLIALPLQGQALKQGNSVFVDENWLPYDDQWGVLFATPKLRTAEIEAFLKENASAEPTSDDPTKPWERRAAFEREDVSGTLQITLANRIYVHTANLKPRIQNQIRRLAAVPNPSYFRNISIGLSNFGNPRYIYLGEDDGGYICLPRGLLEPLQDCCYSAGIPVNLDDRREAGRTVHAEFNGTLRGSQEQAVERLSAHDCGILSAATAFGKTVVCCDLIARKQVDTLILLESSALIEQWEKAVREFLVIHEELPEFQTKTGRVRKRKDIVGRVQGAHDSSGGIIDIAMAGSLYKNGEPHPRLGEYGMVIVDECHHSASETIKRVLLETKAKFVYGVTATPLRGDGLEKINYMLLGPVRFEYTAKEKAAEQGIDHLVYPRFTRAVFPQATEKTHVSKAYQCIRDHTQRNEMIISDVKECVSLGRTPVVLTKFTDHAKLLHEALKGQADHVFLLLGTVSAKEKAAMLEQMRQIPDSESVILIATGQLIGEGFDLPRLDTLIMAMPVSWKGIVEQYAGRLNRDYAGKKNVIIYDYVDWHIPVFARMYNKRLRAYKQIGYSICARPDPERQEANFIYDADTYGPVFEQDLKSAARQIVISSPALARKKVMRLIAVLKERQEAGVAVTLLTWHPDSYRYGNDVHRMELIRLLLENGFQVKYMTDNCERFACIDNEIIWYGSADLLSKDDVDDHIIRLNSPALAEELLEMAFGAKDALKEVQGEVILL